MKYDSIKDAVYAWVESFNAIPQAVIEKLWEYDNDSLSEVTPPAVGDTVTVYINSEVSYGEIIKSKIVDGGVVYTVSIEDREYDCTSYDIVEVERYGMLPMWGTMWYFGSVFDESKLEDPDMIQLMADCGFRIYEQEDLGYVFGIDGAGYDFYEDHWIPLYKAFGMNWHKSEG